MRVGAGLDSGVPLQGFPISLASLILRGRDDGPSVSHGCDPTFDRLDSWLHVTTSGPNRPAQMQSLSNAMRNVLVLMRRQCYGARGTLFP
jgi:hypothetical protein